MPIPAPPAVRRISLLPPLWAQNTEAGFARPRAGPAGAASATSTTAAGRASRMARLFLLEHVLGDEGGGHRGRPAGIEREVGDDFAQLGLGDAVVEGAFEMADQLLLPAERDQGRDHDQAAVALRQARTLPDIAEQHLLGIVDQPRDDVADRVTRRGRLRL